MKKNIYIKKYIKIIAKIPRGELISDGNDDFCTLKLYGVNWEGDPDLYCYSNWSLDDLKKLGEVILRVVKEVEEV